MGKRRGNEGKEGYVKREHAWGGGISNGGTFEFHVIP
jgi:hypothetical protein